MASKKPGKAYRGSCTNHAMFVVCCPEIYLGAIDGGKNQTQWHVLRSLSPPRSEKCERKDLTTVSIGFGFVGLGIDRTNLIGWRQGWRASVHKNTQFPSFVKGISTSLLAVEYRASVDR